LEGNGHGIIDVVSLNLPGALVFRIWVAGNIEIGHEYIIKINYFSTFMKAIKAKAWGKKKYL
jgi:hypothetical protein